MNKKILSLAFGMTFLTLPIAYADNYYVSGKIGWSKQKADDMESSHRPGIGSFVKGDDNDKYASGSVAAGYRFDGGWRTELEYTFPKKVEYTSGSSIFRTSYNHHKIRSQRLMINGYKDFIINDNFSIFGTLGIGVSSLKSSGWQGNINRQYYSQTETNLSYAIGAGVTYTPVQEVNIDLGYRYVDMGKAESGWNNFRNARGLQDEKMKAKVINNEIYVGIRYNF